MRYTYYCKACDEETDFDFEMGTAPDRVTAYCSTCQEERKLTRVWGASAVFKGPGFYRTDYKEAR